jgi:hypothetical protein
MLNHIRGFNRQHPNLTMILALLALFALAQLVLGTRATPIGSHEALEARLADGRPTLIEFYSNL